VPAPAPAPESQQLIYLPYPTSDETAVPEPEQASQEELTDRINQSLSDISDTVYGITNILQVASGS
jgi:hypothetical protein